MQALRRTHAGMVDNGRRARRSCDLDDCFCRAEPDANRWDYLVENVDAATGVAIEVHPAVPREVKTMIRKRDWARGAIADHASHLTSVRWVWLASGRVALPPTTAEFRRLRAAGIEGPTRRARL